MGLTPLLFLAFFLAGCVLAFARHPIWGLGTYVLVLYLHPPSRWWGEPLPDMRWSLLAAAVTLIAVLIKGPGRAGSQFFKHGAVIGVLIFLSWAVTQTAWAIGVPKHLELLSLLFKYVLLMWLIYVTIEREEHLRLFLWAHVLGCLFLGWVAFESYTGGRFEGFGGPDINEANAGALQIITGIFAGAALLLNGGWGQRVAVVAVMPLIVNGLVVTQSRSGLLALAAGGIVFCFYTPRKYKAAVIGLSVLAVSLFLMLTNPQYWARIGTMLYGGAEVEGVDTGSSRLAVVDAQFQMFREHPFGCGHRCTAYLSTEYIDEEHLTGVGDQRGRSSHSTLMTMLVEHGIPGITLYLGFLLWVAISLAALTNSARDGPADSKLAAYAPGIAAGIAAVTVGDLFVDYLKLEVRFWLIAALMALTRLRFLERSNSTAESPVRPPVAPAHVASLTLREAADSPEPASVESAPVESPEQRKNGRLGSVTQRPALRR